MAPMKPCIRLEDNCHCTVFFKLVANLSKSSLERFKGISAFDIDLAKFIKAVCPLLPILVKAA